MTTSTTYSPATINTAGRHYVIVTDGSYDPNSGTGGWGAVIQLKQGDDVLKQRALAGQGEAMISTNNRMEMTAPIMALQRLVEPIPVIIMSDSEYVVLAMNGRLVRWKAAGWRNSGGPVKNRELWEQLDQLCQGRAVEWVLVKSHSGHELNEMADQLAGNASAGRYPNGEKSVMRRHPGWFF